MAGPPGRPGAAWKAWLAAGLNAHFTALWQSPKPGVSARLLQPLSWLYAALADGHQALYRLGLLKVETAPVPVLVVGNLVAGGAGKTPTVLALIGLLRQQGWTPGVISRGHGRRGGEVRLVTRSSTAAEVGDEPLLIHLRTAAPVAVGADRAAAARALCASHPAVDLLVADDGLQHHRLKHDMALLVFDERGVGNGLRLPAGPLRQALPSRLPPRSLVLYSAGRPSTALPGLTGRRQLGGVWSLQAWWQGQTDAADQSKRPDASWAALRDPLQGRPQGRRLLAAAGLARPAPFFAMLEAQGLQIDRLPLADHHRFDPLPWPAGTVEVIVTEKDAVKLPPASVGNTRVWVATLDFQLEPAFDAALRTLCAPFRRPHEP